MDDGEHALMWKMLDPILLKIARRMEHLALHQPSNYSQERTRSRGNFSKLATVTNDAVVQSAAARDHLEADDYAYVDGEIYLLAPESRCRIGHHSFLAAESRLWVLGSITIGDYVHIAPRVDIFDNDSHSLDAGQRRRDAIASFEQKIARDWSTVAQADVVIEDDVWISTKSTILKGVRLGRGCVVAAGSVVTDDVEPLTLVGGNPARKLRHLSG
jgi:acetyltransferase-like isoleucine patch superfamily enzyme